jgi:hypothetical protein
MSLPKPLDLEQQATITNMIAEVILLAPCGGVLGIIGYVAFAFVYDEFVLEPLRTSGSSMPPYGELWGCLALLAGVLAAWATAAIILAWRWSLRGGGAMAILGGVAMGSLVGLLRYASQSQHGADPSDGITFHPIMVASVLVVVGGAILTLRKVRDRKSVLSTKY